MQRISTLLIVSLFLVVGLRAQVITLTFEATLNGSPSTLDSIRVMNLTSGGDTMIYFPDNVVVLDGSTGLLDMDSEAPLLRNRPNPFDGATEILLGTQTAGQILVKVHDASGREVTTYAGDLSAGQHRFRFTAGIPGVHVLTVLQAGRRTTHRLVALDGDASGADLTYAGVNGGGGVAKSDRSLFTWMPGDELRYIGYATEAGVLQSAAIDEVPVATATQTFELFAGLVCPDSPTVTDVDGNVYRTVQIGGQCWMAENLRTTAFANGDPIPNVAAGNQWAALSSGAWAHYSNDGQLEHPYGKLYNWYAVTDPGNVCPVNWHVPADVEWSALIDHLDPNNGNNGEYSELAGGMMKSTGTLYWDLPNAGATNESGFSGHAGGFRSYFGGFFNFFGGAGYWWSATESGPAIAWSRNLVSNVADVTRFGSDKRDGYSVRCIRD